MLTPWMDVERTFAELDLLRRRASGRPSARPTEAPTGRFQDTGEALVFWIAAPGVTESDIRVDVTRETLTLALQRTTAAPEGYTPQRRERADLVLRRTFSLPAPVDADAATAKVKDGVLTVTLPKVSEVRPRTIPVTSN